MTIRAPLLAALLGLAAATGVRAEAPCRIYAGQSVVAIEVGSVKPVAGRLCIERDCRDIVVDSSGLSVPKRAMTGDVITFRPRGAAAGCVAVGAQRPSWIVQALPAIVAGGFTFLAGISGLLGAAMLEGLRNRRDRRIRGLEWIESYRVKLGAFGTAPTADRSAPALPPMDQTGYLVLRDLQHRAAAEVSAITLEDDHRTRKGAVERALAVLDGVKGL